MRFALHTILVWHIAYMCCGVTPSGLRLKKQSILQTSIKAVLGSAAHHRIGKVEASVKPSFDILPKDTAGFILPQEGFSSITRRYFLKEHGWLIVGLEPPSPYHHTYNVHDATVLLEQAPELAKALREVHESGTGLAFRDVVGTIASIEHLLLNEYETILKGAYALNDLRIDAELDEASLHEILRAFMLLFRDAGALSFNDLDGYLKMKERAEGGPSWPLLTKFELDIVADSGYHAPYSFNTTGALLYALGEKYGKWQNSECLEMKAVLMEMGQPVSGLVDWDVFHAEPKHPVFSFTESYDYLRQSGSLLEETESGKKPSVLIPNYLLSRTNCIAPSKHYSVCCLSECESLLSDLERKVQIHTVDPETLLDAVTHLVSSSIRAPRMLSRALIRDLHDISSRHGRSVPLHSADFLKWFHAAFPNECPLPTEPESAEEEAERMSAEEWLQLHQQQQSTRVPHWHPVLHEEM